MFSLLFLFCFWIAVLFIFIWRFSRLSKTAINHLHKMHQIPCSDCVFFSHEYYLKCPLHPKVALSEQAIDCQDFESNYGRTAQTELEN